jgi:hypothetical protein
MGSNLVNMINSIAALPVELDGDIVDVWVTSDIMDSAEYPQLPVRIIHPIGVVAQRSDMQTLGAGTVLKMEWLVKDMVLVRPVGMGLGIRDVADLYIEYMVNYAQQIRQLVANTWKMTSVEINPQIVEYTAGSGRKYHAVICNILLSELVQ